MNALMNTETIIDLFVRSARQNRDNTAFNHFDQSWETVTYGEFLGYTNGIASYLVRSRIKSGDRIAIVSESRVEWCAAYLGILLSGGIAVPVDAQLGATEVANLLTDSSVVLAFHSLRTEANIKGLVNTVNFDSSLFRDILNTPHLGSYPTISEEDLASIVYTSGTTGRPKGVMLTHRNFCSDAKAVISANILNRGDNVLSILPLHHTYPFMCTFLVPLFLGATITYPSGMKGPELVATVKEKGVTILVAVPQLLELIRNGILRKFQEMPAVFSLILQGLLRISGKLRKTAGINTGKVIFRSVHRAFGERFRFFASGGARLDPQVMEDLEALGFTILEGYGLTETSPVVTFNPLGKRKPGSAGRPLPAAEIKILNPSDSGEGEIAIRGPMVMKGYYRNSEETSEVLRDGWFMTGDLGYLNEENYLFITGRAKEMIVLSSGKKVYPEETEKEYLKIPLIKEICVTGAEEREAVESLHALIVPNFDYARKERIGNINDALKWGIREVSMTLPPYMRLKGFIIYQDPLPRTPLGKLKRYMIKDLLKQEKGEGQEKREEDRTLMSDDVGKAVVECIIPLLRERVPVRASDNLELDLGLDSLQRIELVVSIERAFSMKLPETFVSEVQNVDELVQKIKEFKAKGVVGENERPPAEDFFTAEINEKEKRRIGFRQGALERAVTVVLLSIIRLIFKLFFSLRVKGVENLLGPPFIIAPNHSSNLDGFALASSLPRGIFERCFFQGFQIYFTGWGLSLFGRLAHAIPIDPETFLGNALRLSSYVLRNRRILCIFPEGGRSSDGEIMPFKKGMGILAIKHNVPAVPTLIEGTFKALPKGAFWPKASTVSVTFGKPFYPAELDLSRKPKGVDEYQFFADELREKVKRLVSGNHN
jgi:long-chain acyl-CoA synthetase